MVAAAKLRRAQERMFSARPYAGRDPGHGSRHGCDDSPTLPDAQQISRDPPELEHVALEEVIEDLAQRGRHEKGIQLRVRGARGREGDVTRS